MNAFNESKLSHHIKVNELRVVVALASDQIDGAETRDAPGLDAGDDLLTHDALVGVSVLVGGPASPQAADHERQCSESLRVSGLDKTGTA